MAQSFNRPIVESSFYGFNDTDPADTLPSGVFTKVDNAFVSDNQIMKVPGSTAIADAIASQTINGISAYEKISASLKYLVVNIDGASNAQLYTWSGSGNFSAIGSANLTNAKTMNFETANDYLFGLNGTEVVDWDGTTVTKNRAGVPVGFFPKWFHNYLFVAKTSSFPNRLFWSNLGDPTTFDAANFVDINPGDSDQCMGLGVLQDELFYFKQNTIWSITGWSSASFSSTTINTQNTNARLLGYGCVAPQSIVSTGNDIYFLSFLGSVPVIRSLRKTQLAATLGGGVISEDIRNTMSGLNLSNLSKVVGIFDGRYAMWGVPNGSSSVNNLVLVLDTWNIGKINGKTVYPWSTMTGKNIGHATISTISGQQVVYFSDSGATGKVFKIDSSVHTDDGTAITMDVRTRDFVLDLSRKAKWKYIYVTFTTGSSGSLQVNARIDQALNFTNQDNVSLQGDSPGLGSFVLGTSILGGANVSTAQVVLASLVGHALGIQFLESTANNCVIRHYQIYGKAKGLRSD